MIYLAEGISKENLAILYADSFVSRICDDDMEFAEVVHPLVTYLSAFVDDVFIGAYLLVRFSETEFEVHSLLMKKATLYSRKLCELMFEWVFGHPCILRITGYVREGIQTCVNHCLKMGFIHEGFRRDAIRINGEPKGIHVLGITRRDWEAL